MVLCGNLPTVGGGHRIRQRCDLYTFFCFSHLKTLHWAWLFCSPVVFLNGWGERKMAAHNLFACYKPELSRHTLPWWPLSQRVHLATSTGDRASQL